MFVHRNKNTYRESGVAYGKHHRIVQYDGKHPCEDTIEPAEDACEQLSGRIAVMGGIICRRTPEEVFRRSREMLEHMESRGGYALGSGNSIPEYVPQENYFVMISAAVGPIDFIASSC